MSVFSKPCAMVKYTCEDHRLELEDEYSDVLDLHYWDDKTQLYERIWIDDYYEESKSKWEVYE